MKLRHLKEFEGFTLSENIAEKFSDIGNQQRGTPEILMVKLQHYMGGGVLSSAIEHVGDLLHRMTHHAIYNRFYPDLVYEKANKIHRLLTNPYGFEREMKENFVANSKYKNIPFDEFKENIDKNLLEYSNAHAQLPVYNKLQYAAREAAIQLGKKNFEEVINILDYLKTISKDVEKFNKLASEYTLDANETLKIFTG